MEPQTVSYKQMLEREIELLEEKIKWIDDTAKQAQDYFAEKSKHSKEALYSIQTDLFFDLGRAKSKHSRCL